MDIDNLSISLKTNGADNAVKNIQIMADAVEKLAKGVEGIDSSRLESFANGLSKIKAACPTQNQATNLTWFASAVKQLGEALSGMDISRFSNDLSNMANAAQSTGKRAVNNLTHMTDALQRFQTQSTQSSTGGIGVNAGVADRTAASAQKIANEVSLANAELNKTAISVNSIGAKLAKIKALVPTKQFKSLQEQADKTKAKFNEVRDAMQKGLASGNLQEGSKEYEKMQTKLEALRNEYDRLIQKQTELAMSGKGFQLNPSLQKGLESFKSGFTSVIKLAGRGLAGAFKAAGHGIASFTKHLYSANVAQKALSKTMSTLKSLPQKFAKELTRVFKMLKLMITRMALRKVIEEIGNGFKSLAIHSDEFNQSVSNLVNGSKQLGYSFSAMVSPLINALAPAIEYVIDLLIKLVNTINQVLSSLTGASTWNRAKKFTDSYRDSVNSANKAAKDLKKTVLGFDELNQLQDNKNSGGSGNDITDMFETVKIDDKWKEFADWLKEMWKNKDFYDLGKLWGTKIRDALESIPWADIRNTSRGLGKAIATLINGLVETERLGYDIGRTIAKSFMTVFDFANMIVHKLEWGSIGKFIADTFNGFFGGIEWDLIKDTVVTGLEGLAEAINEFIGEFEWDRLSNFVINGLDTVATGIRTFFTDTDFGELGTKLGEQLQKIVKDTDWRDIGRALGSILQAAIDFLSNLLDELEIEDIRQALKDLVDGFFDMVDSEELGAVLGTILQGVIDLVKGFIEDNGDTFKEEGGKLLKGFFDNVDEDELKSIISTVLEVAIVAGVAKMAVTLAGQAIIKGFGKLFVKLLFGEVPSLISKGFTKLAPIVKTGVSNLGSAMAKVPSALGTATTAVGQWMTADVGAVMAEGGAAAGGMAASAVAAGVAAGLVGAEVGKKAGELIFPDDKELYQSYSGIKGTWNMIKDASVMFAEETSEDVSEAWKLLKERTGEHMDNIKESTNNCFDNIKEAGATFVDRTKEHWDNASNALSDFADGVAEKASNIKDKFADLKDKAGEKLNSFKDTVVSNAQNVKDRFLEMAQNVVVNKDNMVASVGDLKTKVGERFSNIKTSLGNFGTTWSSIWDKAKEHLSNFKTKGADLLNNIKDAVIKCFDGIKTGIKAPINAILGFVDKLVNGVIDAFNGMGEKLGSIDIDVPDWVPSIGGKEFSISMPKLQRVNIPRLATGGFPEDGLFFANHSELVGEFSNGKTAVANNAQIISGIENGVYNGVMSAMSQQSSSSQYISNTIMVDGDVIARSVTKAQDRRDRRYSPNMA